MIMRSRRGAVAGVVTVALVLAAGVATRVLATPTAPQVTTGAANDTYTRAGVTDPAGAAGALVVGGGGGAVTYLKFDVTDLPAGGGPLTAVLGLVPLRLGGPAAASTIDAHSVADTTWSESSLTASNAPAPGPVAASASLDPSSTLLSIDVSRVVTAPGTYSFALTEAAGAPQRLFVSEEGGGLAGGPRLVLTRGPAGPPTTVPPTPPTVPPTPPGPPPTGDCVLGAKLVPTCGVMLGVAPAAHTSMDRFAALTSFEAQVGHDQAIYHAYHSGESSYFPNAEEIAMARQVGHPRLLYLNWKPTGVSWAEVAMGDPFIDRYLDNLASYIRHRFTSPFFFTIWHEPENEVIEAPGSGYTAEDYAAMYRHVVLRLRGDGVDNLVTVMNYMSYPVWNTASWFDALYPGDDVVDWIGWDMYGFSVPRSYGYGDFAEMLTRTNASRSWPGMYAWAAREFPNKPFIVGEWGIWYSGADPTHQADVFTSVAAEISAYPQIKAMLYFDTPRDERGLDSLVSATVAGLLAYRDLVRQPMFQVGPAG